MRTATLEVRLEELGALRSFSRPRVSNDNRYSEPLDTGLTIPTGLSAAKKKPANGFPHLLIGITTNTAIAASNLLRLSKGIAVRLWRSAASETMFMNRLVWQIQNAGADQFDAGNNQNWCGSTRQLMI